MGRQETPRGPPLLSPRESFKIFFFFLNVKTSEFSFGRVVEEGKPELFLGKEITSAGRYQERAFPSCQVICNETRSKKTATREPLYRRMAGWGLAGWARADTRVVPMPLDSEVFNSWDQSRPSTTSHPYHDTSHLLPDALHRWRRVRNAQRLSPEEPERGGLLSPDTEQRLLFSTLAGHGTGSSASLSPCFRGMGGRGHAWRQSPVPGEASERRLEHPCGVGRGEQPERGQGAARPAPRSCPGARTGPRGLRRPRSRCSVPGPAREAHLAWSSAAAPWAWEGGGGAEHGASGLAVGLVSARPALALTLAWPSPSSRPSRLASRVPAGRNEHITETWSSFSPARDLGPTPCVATRGRPDVGKGPQTGRKDAMTRLLAARSAPSSPGRKRIAGQKLLSSAMGSHLPGYLPAPSRLPCSEAYPWPPWCILGQG